VHFVPGENEPTVLVGLIRVRSHCTFTWRRPEDMGERQAILRDHHCDECIAHLEDKGWSFIDERETMRVVPRAED
jgi:hypothetical protein